MPKLSRSERRKVAYLDRIGLTHPLPGEGFRKRIKFGTRVGRTVCLRIKQVDAFGGNPPKRAPGPNNAGLRMTHAEAGKAIR